LRRKDGEIVDVLLSSTPLDPDDLAAGVTFTALDITARKQAQEALSRRAAHQAALNAVIAAAAAAPNLPDLLGGALDHTLSALGLDAGAIWVAGERAVRNLPQEIYRVVDLVAQEVSMVLPEPVVVEDWQAGESAAPLAAVMAPAMDRFGVRASLTVPIAAEGRPIGGLSLTAPETRSWSSEEIGLVEAVGRELGGAVERLRLLDRVRAQAQQMQHVMDTVPEGVLLLGADSRVLLVNPVARRYLDLLSGAATGDILTRLGDRPLAELLTSPPSGLWHQVATDGLVFEVVARPLENGPEPLGWVLVIRDVTQEREIQRHVQQQERLAAIGQLAAGIAHDFNNIMAVITLYADMSLRIPGLPAKLYERLETMDQQARRASDLIQQILDFSRRAVLERRPMNLQIFLKEQVKLLERTLPEHIQMELTYDEGDHMVNADPTRVQQAIMNLAVNARDAMPEGGWLRIGLKRISVTDPRRAPLPEMEAGDWVQMSVTDSGTGIPPDVLPHIFEPFFTTRAPEGTGLGLAQVYGIVGQHEGHVDVETAVGEGTTFVLYLPALPLGRPDESALRGEDLDLFRGRGQTILVVEDEPATRRALVDGLELLGYRVLQATDGREALALYEQRGGGIDLVLSDAVMPQMGGQALFWALRERDPAVKVVLVTGHPLERELEGLQAEGLAGWLLKPLDIDRLARVVAEALAAD
jgi:signal transduction histidine kinase/ActR/RegA family two-component response regulator